MTEIKIDCISDLHGAFPELEGGDLLIVAGDLTAHDTQFEYINLFKWLIKQKYKKIIIVCGNHDGEIQNNNFYFEINGSIILCDSGTEFEGLKIWGTPWSKTFPGMNPHCKAFTVETEAEMEEKFKSIPDDIDILISHDAPLGILDSIKKEGNRQLHVGSAALRNVMFQKKIPLMIFGHIHEWGGKTVDLTQTLCVNASIMNEHYKPVNKPVRVIYDSTTTAFRAL